MKILYWTERFYPDIGGIEILSSHLIPALNKRGHQLAVVTSHNGMQLADYEIHDDIPIYRFHFSTSLANRNLSQLIASRRQIAQFKQSFQADLVHLHFSGASSYFHLHTSNTHPSPTLVTMHTLPTNREGKLNLLRQTLSAADWVSAVSLKMLTEVRQIVPEIAQLSSVIYNGLKSPRLKPEPVSFEPIKILCVGRLVELKGFDLALTALASLLVAFPNTSLTIAGDGVARANLERQAADLNLGEAVEFTGWVAPEKIPELINSASVVVVPSRMDSLPVVAQQAAQLARPIVATRVGGLPEIVSHGQTGLLVEPEDSDGLVEAITFLLQHPDMARSMGLAAQRRMEEVFGWQQFVDEYDNLYHKLRREFIS